MVTVELYLVLGLVQYKNELLEIDILIKHYQYIDVMYSIAYINYRHSKIIHTYNH